MQYAFCFQSRQNFKYKTLALYTITNMFKKKNLHEDYTEISGLFPFSLCPLNDCSQYGTCLKYFLACLKFIMPQPKHCRRLRESTL